ncbi:hypothetical protein BH24CHL3_BH24CHL3_07900 [soil metagenome]
MNDQPGVATTSPTIACQLTDRQLAARREEIQDNLLRHVEEIQELDDGFAYRFPSADPWASAVFDFIDAERRCCSFFTFEVVFEPNNGSLWLRLRGSAEVKMVSHNQLDAEPALASRSVQDDTNISE